MDHHSKMLADWIMVCAGIIGQACIVPQIVHVWRHKSASQLSWVFLLVTCVAIVMFMTGKLLMGCYFASVTDFITLVCYVILTLQKWYYGSTARDKGRADTTA